VYFFRLALLGNGFVPTYVKKSYRLVRVRQRGPSAGDFGAGVLSGAVQPGSS
jgi:hypothetical protein